MLAGTLVVAAVAGLVACLALLVVAPRLSWFDDQRRRGLALVAMAAVLGLLGLGAVVAVRREVARREAAAGRELYGALQGTTAADLLASATGGGPLPPGATSVAELQGGGVAVYRPVSVLWARWCVVGVVALGGRVTIERLHRRCP